MIFRRKDALGEFALRYVDPVGDAPLLHTWVTHPKSAFWMMQRATLGEVATEYAAIAARPGHDALLGFHDGTPAFLAERYDPHGELSDVYPVQPGDVGMHFLVAPTDTPLSGFTRAVMVTVMELLFADPMTSRVVVEPDARNTAVHALNAYAGFTVAGTVRLPHKDALLSFCTRERFEAARTRF
ncbi:MAG: acetyltransferase [Hamadaea sp.]|nr:acetyltransferase [Hamadaea sp.]